MSASCAAMQPVAGEGVVNAQRGADAVGQQVYLMASVMAMHGPPGCRRATNRWACRPRYGVLHHQAQPESLIGEARCGRMVAPCRSPPTRKLPLPRRTPSKGCRVEAWL